MPYRTRSDLPHPTRVIRHVWVPMRDGTRLSARVWLPLDAESQPVPAILEYIPYRKGDMYADEDEQVYRYLAGHGYAGVRVDIRGTGDSEGRFVDEYLPLEQQDGVDVIKWIAEQPWCSGKVGMTGISWGGFNSLQVAAHAPPALAAVITIGFTDDRYEDDIHYIGGCLFARYQLMWATSVVSYMARPPDPATVGSRWREMWMDRLQNASAVIEPWLMHQHRDAYWKQGSVCENYGAIKCPVYAIGGWQDGYTNAVFRMLEHFPGPCKGLVGPWGHHIPHYGVPGPAIGWLQEALRWWDYWLKGIDTGVMTEPKLRYYSQDAVAPAATYPHRPGHWACEPGWPSPNVEHRRLSLGRGTLGGAAGPKETLRHVGNLLPTGDAGNWAGWGHATEFPTDQRPEDGQWLSFDSDPLAAAIEILGQPLARLELSVDRPLALVAARLCDVAPDGRSTLITRGVLNLTQHASREQPHALTPGEAFSAAVKMKAISYVVPVGHRLRLALSTCYWPWTWPAPELVAMSVSIGGASLLELPVRRSPVTEIPEPAHFAEPEAGPGLAIEYSHLPGGGRATTMDAATGRHVTVDMPTFFSSARLSDDDNLEFSERDTDEWEIVEGDPLSAKVTCRRTLTVGRGAWQTRIEVVSSMTSTRETFLVTTVLEAFESGHRIRAQTWTHTIPRKLI